MIKLTPEDFANIAGMMYSVIPHISEGGTFMIESKKDNLFFVFTNGDREIRRSSLVGE